MFMFGGEDLIYSSNLDVFQEVIVEDEIQDVINVENSRSNTPGSATNDSCSNENSVSSFATSESVANNRFWTREEDLTPSAVLPDNLFMEADEDIKSFNFDENPDLNYVDMNDDLNFNINQFFGGTKEESTSKPSSLIKCEPNVKVTDDVMKNKAATRRRIKAEPLDTAEKEV